ncbi:histidine phosphatase family protein [Clostridium gasigenes]|uniref:histidine phosphatase family protein n=1 Tax=Clostridium gasigenes TaxID=94869 RepID=UPI0014384DE1|nr:histidine phosphatase family protein [Clostridium gasigenes]NKF08479.1 histidine phosphatase family protein [Clostridium gasigenes]QSW21294.1 histidine phosphatase family protein [Clostridium gasigenes]
MTKLYITRHGETEWNTKGIMQGFGNSPLTELGREQGKWLRDRMNDLHIDVIYSSPSGRAYETAEIIKGDRDIELLADDGLREINMGQWEGLCQDEIKELSEENHFNFWNLPSKYISVAGENYYESRERSYNTITKILEKEKGKTILIVTHTVTLKGFLNMLQNQEIDSIVKPPFIKQTSLTEIDFNEEGYKILNLACMEHHEYSRKEFNE